MILLFTKKTHEGVFRHEVLFMFCFWISLLEVIKLLIPLILIHIKNILI